MVRRLVVIWVFFALVVGIGTLTSFGTVSCASVPDGECRADRTNVLHTYGDPDAAAACTTCLQRNCCDIVGTCNEDEKRCPDEVKTTQACVIAGGPSAEAQCKSNLKQPASFAVYDCMRPKCGDHCGLPTCKLNTSVTLFGSADCDRCVGSACCTQVNSCYENRQCKLFLECITQHCPNTLGPTLSASASRTKEELEASRLKVCANGPPPEQIAQARCLGRCLEEFTGKPTPDDQEAQCLAFGVYTCAAGAKCGATCTREGGVVREGAYAQDLEGLDAGVQ